MIYFLKLPPLMGSLIAILFFIAFTCTLFFIAHIFLGGKRHDKTRTFAQQMALRIGTLHALIISLVFGALASDYIDLEKTPDKEAAAVGSVYATMQDLENWQPSLPFESKIKNYCIDKMFSINEMRISRLYGWYREDIPTVFWLIAVAGFFLTLFPYLSVELNRFRLILINCYAAMIGITFYGIVLLNNPFLCGLVAPSPHKMIYEQIKTFSSSDSRRLPTSHNVFSKKIFRVFSRY